MMKISSAEAFRELNSWNNESRVGCTFTVKSAGAVFAVRRGRLDIREFLVFIESETGRGMVDLADCSFALTEAGDMPFNLKRGFPPLPFSALRVLFRNEDVCFFFPD
jgi:hypothetical protein